MSVWARSIPKPIKKREQVEMSNENKWVPVEERLPPSGDDVLVFGLGVGFAGAGEVRLGTYWRDAKTWSVGESEFREQDAEVTHWQPLPAPPSKSKG